MSHSIVTEVNSAKESMHNADNLIKKYLPFIKSQASRTANRSIDDSDDELSIGMIAFHEAIQAYQEDKGNFLSFAGILIKNRIIDYYRKESKHFGHESFDQPDENNISLAEKIEDQDDQFETIEIQEVARKEIMELQDVLASFDLSFTDIAEQTPKQDRTLAACGKAVQYAIDHPPMLEEIAKSGKLPITKLARKSKISKKTLERHRRYILAVMIIQTNGFEMVRQHVKGVLALGKELVK